MHISTLESMPGFKIIRQLELVSGNTVRSKDFIADAFASFKNVLGGEIEEYTELLKESRQEALRRMIEKAQLLGANAIVGVRFSTSNIANEASELFVYGTAVIVEPLSS